MEKFNYLAILVASISGATALLGVQGGFWSWRGFICTTRITDGMFERRSHKLVWINNGYRLTWLVVMGVTIAVWK